MNLFSRLTLWQQLAESCGLSTVQQGLQQVWRLLLLCLLCRFCFRLGAVPAAKHVASLLAGLYGLFLFFEWYMLWVLLLSALCYLVLILSQHSSRRGLFLSVVILIYLLIGELHLIDMVTWHKIRGSQMVVAMKAISLAFDLDRGTVASLPSLTEFLGYVLFVGTVVFGPWISFSSYKNALEGRKLSWPWLCKSSLSLLKSQICLLVSTCIAPYLFTLFIPIYGSPRAQKWLNAYENAVSFHFSNYFVGHLSEGTSMLAGAGFIDEKRNTQWDIRVVEPLNVEMPRSMVLVVTSWNIPMSQWLKTSVNPDLLLQIRGIGLLDWTAKGLPDFAALLISDSLKPFEQIRAESGIPCKDLLKYSQIHHFTESLFRDNTIRTELSELENIIISAKSPKGLTFEIHAVLLHSDTSAYDALKPV